MQYLHNTNHASDCVSNENLDDTLYTPETRRTVSSERRMNQHRQHHQHPQDTSCPLSHGPDPRPRPDCRSVFYCTDTCHPAISSSHPTRVSPPPKPTTLYWLLAHHWTGALFFDLMILKSCFSVSNRLKNKESFFLPIVFTPSNVYCPPALIFQSTHPFFIRSNLRQ